MAVTVHVQHVQFSENIWRGKKETSENYCDVAFDIISNL